MFKQTDAPQLAAKIIAAWKGRDGFSGTDVNPSEPWSPPTAYPHTAKPGHRHIRQRSIAIGPPVRISLPAQRLSFP